MVHQVLAMLLKDDRYFFFVCSKIATDHHAAVGERGAQTLGPEQETKQALEQAGSAWPRAAQPDCSQAPMTQTGKQKIQNNMSHFAQPNDKVGT